MAALVSSEDCGLNDSVMASWFVVDDVTASELSSLLDLFEAPPPPTVMFIDNPYSASVVFQSSSAYVTINGNEESCGSSFSDSDSSVMASVDLGGASWRRSRGEWGFDFAVARQWWGEAEMKFLVDGWNCDDHEDGFDGGDAMWVEFLGEEGSGIL